MPDLDQLIENLSEDLTPVRRVSASGGLILLAAVALATLAATAWIWGFSAAVRNFQPSQATIFSGALFFLLGIAGGSALNRMARPTIGVGNNGWRWAVAAVAILPVAGLILALAIPSARVGLSVDGGISCLIRGLIASVATAAVITWRLRRGAPLRLHTAAWLVGLTAGAVGALAVALNCPDDALTHIGLWHAGIVAVAGLAGRLALPPLLRW